MEAKVNGYRRARGDGRWVVRVGQNANFFQRRLSEVKAMKGILLTTDFT